jgi:membrane protease YdiL (CAAX protease family)
MPFWLAAGISGVVFGSVHLTTGDVAVAGLLSFLGVILAWLYERTGSLGPPIALHMVNNAIAIVPLLSG